MLLDSYNRKHDYLRISVTERCNLRCTYCMPENGVTLKPKESLLTFEEITNLARIFVGLGVRKIRFTGGEPLVRHGIEDLIGEVGQIPHLKELALSTNGTLLPDKLNSLWDAGVTQLNISLDTLRGERFERITRRDNFEPVLRAIEASVQFRGTSSAKGFRSIKINVVVMRDVNDDELLHFVNFVSELALKSPQDRMIEVRFIEFMPFRNNGWSEEHCVSYAEMRQQIEQRYFLNRIEDLGIRGPAKLFSITRRDTGKDISNVRVGFITSMTDNFCGDCNRLRLTADGQFRTCLFGEDSLDLRDLLRTGVSTSEIEREIKLALSNKWEKHPGGTELVQIGDRDMVMIGG